MTIRLKTMLLILVNVLIALFLMLAATYALSIRWADRNDTNNARENMRRVRALVGTELDNLQAFARDYAVWDDTYAFVLNRNQAYIDSNFVDGVYNNNHIDFILIVDLQGRLVYGRAYDSVQRAQSTEPWDATAALRDIGAFRGDMGKNGMKGLLKLSTGPFLFSAQPILRSDEQGAPVGVLIFGRALEPAVLSSISSITGLAISAFSLNDPLMAADLRAKLVALPRDDPILVTPREAGICPAFCVLYDFKGDPVLVLSTLQPTQFRAQVIAALSTLLALLAIIIIGGYAGITFMLDRMTLSRIMQLSLFTGGVRSAEQLSDRISMKGKDEIVALASSLNGMLDALQREAHRHYMDEERLRTLVDLDQLGDVSDVALTDYALEAVVRLTGSTLGYLAVTSEDGQTLSIQSWSRAAMAECTVHDKPIVYPLASTGLWGEPVRQRRVVITNDYRAEDPLKKGYPPGHVRIDSHMGVPIFEGDRVVMVSGVANKAAPYDEADVRQVTLLMGGMWRQIQKRKAQEALQESEERFRNASQVTGQIIYESFLATGRIRWSGAIAPITGRSPEEFQDIGFVKYQALIHPEDLARMDPDFEKARAGCGSYQVSYRLARPDGSWVWVEDTGVFLNDGGGEATRMLGSLKDISERILAQEEKLRYEEKLQQAAKMEAVGRLAGGVAHDFNNALTGILGYTELLMRSVDAGSETYGELEEIRRAGEHAASLTAQLLAFSRKQVIQPRNVDLNAILRDATTMLARLMGENMRLTTLCAESPVVVRADPSQIEQILINLAMNARDAMPEGGRLSIEVDRARIDEAYAVQHPDARMGEYALLIVSDTGSGMSRDTIAHLFEPFFTTKDPSQGGGLGLAMIYGAVRQNDGFINVYSEPGIGTTFRVYLPLVAEARLEAAAPAGLPPVPRGSETILLVEDEAMVRTLAGRILSRQGYTVIAGADAEEALALAAARAGKIDLLLTDMVMPGTNGKSLYDALKPLRPGMKVVFMSGYAESIIAHQGVLEEGVHFLPKPFTMNALTAAVRGALDGP
jgi:PAS domain S-box-containing protein